MIHVTVHSCFDLVGCRQLSGSWLSSLGSIPLLCRVTLSCALLCRITLNYALLCRVTLSRVTLCRVRFSTLYQPYLIITLLKFYLDNHFQREDCQEDIHAYINRFLHLQQKEQVKTPKTTELP